MAAADIPRISSENCSYPFTYLGGRYHGCVENLENVTAACERWGCFAVNYSAAICAAYIGNTPQTYFIIARKYPESKSQPTPNGNILSFSAENLRKTL